MGKISKNLSVVLGLVTVAFAGYYLFTQNSSGDLAFNENDQMMTNMLNNTQVFIEYSQALNEVQMNIGLFEDERFQSLRSFSTPIQTQPVGRPDPFAEVTASSLNQ